MLRHRASSAGWRLRVSGAVAGRYESTEVPEALRPAFESLACPASLVLIAALSIQTPVDTLRYQVVNHGRHAGIMEVVTVADTIVVRSHRWDRGNETNIQASARHPRSSGLPPSSPRRS